MERNRGSTTDLCRRQKNNRRTEVTAITEGEVSTRTALKRLRKQVHMRSGHNTTSPVCITIIISDYIMETRVKLSQHCNLSLFPL